jgi:hypothetical protein
MRRVQGPWLRVLSSASFCLACSTLVGEAAAQRAPLPRGHLDLRALFTQPEGVLSPGYTDRHGGRTARPLSYASGERGPIFGLLFNPALGAFGKWSLRAELAPVPYVSVFLEGSRVIDADVPRVPEPISGTTYDVGLHLFPMGDGLRGFYLGPRYSRGSGHSKDGLVDGAMTGWGGDIGWQFVVSVIAINIGVGATDNEIVATPSAEAIARGLPAEGLPAEVRHQQVLPLVTAGLGLAF